MNFNTLLSLGLLAARRDYEMIVRRVKEFGDKTGMVHIYYCICEAQLGNPAVALKKLAVVGQKVKLPCSINVAKIVINCLQDVPDSGVLKGLKAGLDADLQLAEIPDLLLAAQLSLNYIGTRQSLEILSAAQAQLIGNGIDINSSYQQQGSSGQQVKMGSDLNEEEQTLLALQLEAKIAEAINSGNETRRYGEMCDIVRRLCHSGSETKMAVDTTENFGMNVDESEALLQNDVKVENDASNENTSKEKEKEKVEISQILSLYNSPDRPYMSPIVLYAIAIFFIYFEEVEEGQNILQRIVDVYNISPLSLDVLSCVIQRRQQLIMQLHSSNSQQNGSENDKATTEDELDSLENTVIRLVKLIMEEREKYSLKRVTPVDVTLGLVKYIITGTNTTSQNNQRGLGMGMGIGQGQGQGMMGGGLGQNTSVDDTITLVEPIINLAGQCTDPLFGLETLNALFSLIPGDALVLQRIMAQGRRLYDALIAKGNGISPSSSIGGSTGFDLTSAGATTTGSLLSKTFSPFDLLRAREEESLSRARRLMIRFLFWTGNSRGVLDIAKDDPYLSDLSPSTLFKFNQNENSNFNFGSNNLESIDLPAELLVILSKIRLMPMKQRIEASRELENCYSFEDFDDDYDDNNNNSNDFKKDFREKMMINKQQQQQKAFSKTQLIAFAAMLSLLTDGRLVSVLAMLILTVPLDSCSSDTCLFALQELAKTFLGIEEGENGEKIFNKEFITSKLLFKKTYLSGSSKYNKSNTSTTTIDTVSSNLDNKKQLSIASTTIDTLVLSPCRLMIPSQLFYKLFEESDLLFDVNRASPRLQSIQKFISLDELASVSWSLYLQAPPAPSIRLQLASLSPVPVALKILSHAREQSEPSNSINNNNNTIIGQNNGIDGNYEDFNSFNLPYRQRREGLAPLIIAEHLYLSSVHLKQTSGNSSGDGTARLSDLTKNMRNSGENIKTMNGNDINREKEKLHQELLHWVRKQLGWNWNRGLVGISELGPAKTHLEFAKIKGYGLLGGREGLRGQRSMINRGKMGMSSASTNSNNSIDSSNGNESITGLIHEQYWPWQSSVSSKLMEYKSEAIRGFTSALELAILREEGRWEDMIHLLTSLIPMPNKAKEENTQSQKDNGQGPLSGLLHGMNINSNQTVQNSQSSKAKNSSLPSDRPRLDSGFYVSANGYSTNISGGYGGFNELELWCELIFCYIMLRDTGKETSVDIAQIVSSLFSSLMDALSPMVLNVFMAKVRILVLKLLIEFQKSSSSNPESRLDDAFVKNIVVKLLQQFPKVVKGTGDSSPDIISDEGLNDNNKNIYDNINSDMLNGIDGLNSPDLDISREADKDIYIMLQQTIGDLAVGLLKDNDQYEKWIEMAHIPNIIKKESFQLRTPEEIEAVGDELFVKGEYENAVEMYIKSWSKRESEEARQGRTDSDGFGSTAVTMETFNTINASLTINNTGSRHNVFARLLSSTGFLRLGRKTAECYCRLYKYSYAQEALKEAIERSTRGIEETKVIVGQEEFLSEYIGAYRTLLEMKIHNSSWNGAYKIVERLLRLLRTKYGLEGYSPSTLRGVSIEHLVNLVHLYKTKAEIFWHDVDIADKDKDSALLQTSGATQIIASSPTALSLAASQNNQAAGTSTSSPTLDQQQSQQSQQSSRSRPQSRAQTASMSGLEGQQNQLAAFFNRCGVSHKVFGALGLAILYQQNGVLTQMRTVVGKGGDGRRGGLGGSDGSGYGVGAGGSQNLTSSLSDEYKNLGDLYYHLTVYYLKLLGNSSLPDDPNEVMEMGISDLSDITLDNGKGKSGASGILGVLTDDMVELIIKCIANTIEDGLNECPAHIGLLVLKIVLLHNYLSKKRGSTSDTGASEKTRKEKDVNNFSLQQDQQEKEFARLQQECEKCCDRLLSLIPGHPFPYTILAEMKLAEGEIHKATAILIQGLCLANGGGNNSNNNNNSNLHTPQILSADSLERIIIYNIRSGTISNCAAILELQTDVSDRNTHSASAGNNNINNNNNNNEHSANSTNLQPTTQYTRGIVFRSIQSNTCAARELKAAIKSGQLSQRTLLNAYWMLAMTYIQPETDSFNVLSSLIYSAKKAAPLQMAQSRATLTSLSVLTQNEWAEYKRTNDVDSKLGKNCKNLFNFRAEGKKSLLKKFTTRAAKLEKVEKLVKKMKSALSSSTAQTMALVIEGYAALGWCCVIRGQISLLDKVTTDMKLQAQQQQSKGDKVRNNSDSSDDDNDDDDDDNDDDDEGGRKISKKFVLKGSDINSLERMKAELEKSSSVYGESLKRLTEKVTETVGNSSGSLLQCAFLSHVYVYQGDMKRASKYANGGISSYRESMPVTVYQIESQVYCAGIRAVIDYTASLSNSIKFFPQGWWSTGIPVGGCAVWKHLLEGLICEQQGHFKTAADVYETIWSSCQFIESDDVEMSDDNWYKWHVGYKYAYALLRHGSYQKCVSIAQSVLREFPMFRKLRTDILCTASEHLFNW